MVTPVGSGVLRSYSLNTKGIQQSQQDKNVKKNKTVAKNCAYFIAGMATVASGMYIAKHAKNIQNPLCCRVLPFNTITESLPNDLKAVIAGKKDNYEQFLSMMANPNPELLHGRGANSSVYRLPFTDKYVMKVLNQNSKSDFRIGALGSRNFGQPVWENPENNRILVLNKIKGKPHSTPTWTSIIWDETVKSPKQVTVEQAEHYYDSMVGISRMKQSAFDDLAGQIKFLDTVPKYEHDRIRGYKVDSINPNNLMVDMENEKLSIIDFFAKDKPVHQNSYMDMVAVISDFALMREYHDLLPVEKQKELIKALKVINAKSLTAAEKTGLSTDKRVFTAYIDETSKYFPVPNVSNFDGSVEYVRSYDQSSRAMMRLLEE